MTNESTWEKIARRTGRKPISCKCQKCQDQCRHTVCLGTPEDIEKLIQAGYIDRLIKTYWGAGMIFGHLSYPILMIQAQETDGGCTFFRNGLCELHDINLKPTEGRLSHHTLKVDNWTFKKSIAWNVAKEWIDPHNAETIKRIFDTYRSHS